MINPKTYSNDPIDSGHDNYLPFTWDHSAMVMMMTIPIIVISIYRYVYGDSEKLKDNQFVEEDAEKYYQTLSGMV